MRRAFTLLEMLIALGIGVMIFYAFFALIDTAHTGRARTVSGLQKSEKSRRIFDLMLYDLMQLRDKPEIIHEAGYDRIAFVSDHSLYGIPRPWIHYFISQKDKTLVRVEATGPVDFYNRRGDRLFFADTLASGCDSLRFVEQYDRIGVLLRCKDTDPLVLSLYRGGK